eukprot:365509-Chlamydomonas_euryale.AAC.27
MDWWVDERSRLGVLKPLWPTNRRCTAGISVAVPSFCHADGFSLCQQGSRGCEGIVLLSDAPACCIPTRMQAFHGRAPRLCARLPGLLTVCPASWLPGLLPDCLPGCPKMPS